MPQDPTTKVFWRGPNKLRITKPHVDSRSEIYKDSQGKRRVFLTVSDVGLRVPDLQKNFDFGGFFLLVPLGCLGSAACLANHGKSEHRIRLAVLT